MYGIALVHHGIKGQQWGVMHGPPYPINDSGETRIKKGSKIHRLSLRDETAAKGHAYVTFLKSDAQHYKGFFGLRLHAGPINWYKKVKEYTYENDEDLISPSKKKRVETFLELYEKDPVLKDELHKYYDKEVRKAQKKTVMGDKWKDADALDTASVDQKYNIFARSLGSKNSYIRDTYFNNLKKKGYNFVIDDLDGGTFGKNPAIIFSRENVLTEKGRVVVSKWESIAIVRKEGVTIDGYSKRLSDA